ncbi:hypothetical protein ACH3XW_28310 [Acanthocheilonema viteae]|uniref:Activin types I and II receptor domain-containing protein n=1 Tax=Acanthocheilonema viteae TaxID=6277 RepID=A0A498SM67_ACAVI|nr:unnamed protein product [Acanthocheilonema viteae]
MALLASTLSKIFILVLLCSTNLLQTKSLSRNTVVDDDELDVSDLIDSFLERAKQNTRHHRTHHRLLRRHRIQSSIQQLTSFDVHGREYVKCRKSLLDGGSVMKRCYRPPSDDMRVGCYAVWNMKSETLVQDCWVQQAISMNNCEQRKCIADRSTFCCCYGHNCNSRFELQEEISDENS